MQNDEADQKRLKKEEFDDFLQNVKKEHQLNKSGGTQSGVDLDLVEAEIRRKEEERRVAHEKKRAEDEERRLALEKKSQQPAPKPVANPQPTIQNPPVQAQPKKVKPEEDF